MQKIRRGTFISGAVLLLALLLLATAGCSLLRRPAPPIDRSADPEITREVLARLHAEPTIDAARIRVEVDGRVVLLFGSVNGIGQWQCAIRTAELVPGVQSVVDYLVIERGPRDVGCVAPRDVS